MENTTLVVYIKEYLEEHSFGELLQLITDIYKEPNTNNRYEKLLGNITNVTNE